MTRTLLTVISIVLAFVLGMSVMWGYQQSAQQKQVLDDNVYSWRGSNRPGVQFSPIVIPPSTTISAPVIYTLSSEPR